MYIVNCLIFIYFCGDMIASGIKCDRRWFVSLDAGNFSGPLECALDRA